MWTICGKRRFQVASAAILSAMALFLSSCKNDAKTESPVEKCGEIQPLEFSKNLKLGTTCGHSVAEIRSIVGRDTLVRRFILQKRATEGTGTTAKEENLPPELSSATVLHVPLQKVAVLTGHTCISTKAFSTSVTANTSQPIKSSRL